MYSGYYVDPNTKAEIGVQVFADCDANAIEMFENQVPLDASGILYDCHGVEVCRVAAMYD